MPTPGPVCSAVRPPTGVSRAVVPATYSLSVTPPPATALARATRRFAGETPIGRKRRARKIARELAETHPDAHCELDFTTPLELAVATILSAQTTDVRVNEVTPKLFARYPDAAAYAA